MGKPLGRLVCENRGLCHSGVGPFSGLQVGENFVWANYSGVTGEKGCDP